MRGHQVVIKAGHAGITAQQLQALATRLENEFGFVAVGVPIYRTFGSPPNDGFVAVALYRTALFTLIGTSTTLNMTVLTRGETTITQIESAIQTELGLQNPTKFRQLMEVG